MHPRQTGNLEIVVDDDATYSTIFKDVNACVYPKLSFDELVDSIGHIIDLIFLEVQSKIKEKEKNRIFIIEKDTTRKRKLYLNFYQEIPDKLLTWKEMQRKLNETIMKMEEIRDNIDDE